MSQRIINAKLVDKNGKIEHDNIDGYLVMHTYPDDNYYTGFLVFTKKYREEDFIDSPGDDNMEIFYLKESKDMEEFRLNSISLSGYNKDDQYLVYTYISHKRKEH
jgi:hypothetical protein